MGDRINDQKLKPRAVMDCKVTTFLFEWGQGQHWQRGTNLRKACVLQKHKHKRNKFIRDPSDVLTNITMFASPGTMERRIAGIFTQLKMRRG